MNTVKHANELGRPVFAVPGPITTPASAGCNRLIRDAEASILVELSDLPIELGWRASHVEATELLGPLDLRAFDALATGFQPVETLLVASGLSMNELRMALGSLKLLGKAEMGETGSWKRTSRT
jgi:DNA processing protein